MQLPNNLGQPVIVEALEKAVDFLSVLGKALKTTPNILAVEPLTPSSISSAIKKVKADRADPIVIESVSIARLLISNHKKPMMMDDLFDAVRARGVQVGTSNPKGTYGARLKYYKDRFNLVYLHGHGWWLAELSYPPANYPGAANAK